MSEVRYTGAWLLLALGITIGCANRPTKPLVLTEQVGEMPVQFTPACPGSIRSRTGLKTIHIGVVSAYKSVKEGLL